MPISLFELNCCGDVLKAILQIHSDFACPTKSDRDKRD